MADEIHVHIDVPEFEAAKYAFRVLLATLDSSVLFHKSRPSGLSPEAAVITYSPSAMAPTRAKHLQLRASRKLWDHYRKDTSLPPSPLPRIPLAQLKVQPSARLRDPLVLPYLAEPGQPVAEVRRESGPDSRVSMEIGVDLVASTFFWISRYEETLIGERDGFGRIPQERLQATRERVTGRPLVDEYRELLMIWLRIIGARVAARKPPFRVFLTHDVDSGIGITGFQQHAESGLRAFYREAIRARRLRTGLRGLAQEMARGLGRVDDAFLFRVVRDLDTEFGFPSFFFLMANGTHPGDATYDILGDASHRVITAIREAGGSVGLHVGLNAHGALAQLGAEWERLRQADPLAWPASRSHYLAFFAPATWRQLSELGFRVDSTIGFSDHMGFGAGTSHAFRPFDVERREILPIWELPLTLMDTHLFRGPESDDAERISAVREVAARVRAHGGCFVINWHNVVFFGHYREVYRAILSDLRDACPVRLEDLPGENGSIIW